MASKYDIVKLHIDTKGFSCKPDSGEKGNTIGSIQWRTGRNIVTLTKEELVRKVLCGFSFIPGVCPISEERKKGGARQKDWLEQQVFALDFDGGITMDEVLARLNSLGVHPFFAYTTFSNSDKKEKFRVAFATSEVVVDRMLRDRLQATLMGLFEGDVDERCADRSRYFNGTKKDAKTYINYDATIDAMEVVSSYWNDECMCHIPKDVNIDKPNKEDKEKGNNDINKSNKPRKKRETKSYEIEVNNNEIPFSIGFFRVNAPANLVALDKVFELRAWVEGDHRERFLFIYYNVAKLKYGSELALKWVLEKNSLMEEPLSDRELYYAITHTENHIEENMPYIHGDGVFPFYRETMASESWLDLTSEELQASGFLDTNIKNNRANANRPIKLAIKELVIELHKEGKENKDIKCILSEEGISLSLRTIQRYTKEYKNDKIPQTTILYNIITTPNEEQNDVVVENNEEALNEQQQYAYDVAMLGRNLALIARGGCGKTYVIRKVINALRAQGKCVGCCAATGLAAQNLDDGKTVHHMFGIISNEPSENYYVNTMVAHSLFDYDTIVIDEVGMLDSETFTKVAKAINYMKTAYNHHIQLIVTGDPLQLESVNGSYFFESPEYNAMGFEEVLLDKNMRQSNRAYDKLLSKLREGKDIHNTISHLNFIYNHEEDENAMYVYAHKLRAIQKNNEVLATLPGEEIRLDAYLSVKIGAKVIVTTNARPNRYGVIKYYNGMQGTIKEVKANSVIVEKMDGSLVTIKRQLIALDEDSSYEGYPLALGYALTIHKVQGMTLDSLNIHPSCFACGQLYTALSRVRTSSGVHLLAPIKEKDVKVNQRALEYMNRGLVRDMAM